MLSEEHEYLLRILSKASHHTTRSVGWDWNTVEAKFNKRYSSRFQDVYLECEKNNWVEASMSEGIRLTTNGISFLDFIDDKRKSDNRENRKEERDKKILFWRAAAVIAPIITGIIGWFLRGYFGGR
jgi:hypothetical protein